VSLLCSSQLQMGSDFCNLNLQGLRLVTFEVRNIVKKKINVYFN
jgi:hypothetical protein